jgi:hypothetical protein
MERLSKSQQEAKEYMEVYGLEDKLKDMLTALVEAKDTKPELFMVNYLVQKVAPDDLRAAGLLGIGEQDHSVSSQKSKLEETTSLNDFIARREQDAGVSVGASSEAPDNYEDIRDEQQVT